MYNIHIRGYIGTYYIINIIISILFIDLSYNFTAAIDSYQSQNIRVVQNSTLVVNSFIYEIILNNIF